MDDKKLKKLRNKFDEIKTELAVKQVDKERLKKKLKDEYGIKNWKNAARRKEEIEAKLAKLRKRKELLLDRAEEELKKYEED